MKKLYRIIICLLLSAALILPSSCKSTESAETAAVTTTPEPVVTGTVPIQNMNYTGVKLDETAVIAASALPVPKTPPVT
ncbi:MAG: hypothetical protein J6X60_07645, partial [Ruminiclostridium sp.]|nr:hypothetical protein [Ruminiclostridium sp.]